MTENNALAIYGQFDQLQRAATALQQSGYWPDVKSQAQAIVKVMAGAELGLPPFASMSGIHIVQGKPVLGANVLATLVKNDPRYNYRVKQCDSKICELEWYEDGKNVGVSSFTYEEAKAANLTGKDNWQKYPSDMLFARAISRGARRFAPGIFGGSPVYTPDEMGVEVDVEGYIDAQNIRDVPAIPTETAPAHQNAPRSIPTETAAGALMSLETANAVQNSEGALYGDIDSETLSYMSGSLEKAIKKNPDDDNLKFKRDAIKVILASRN